MTDKIIIVEKRILSFLQESLDELYSIRQDESKRLEDIKALISALRQDLKKLAVDIDRLAKEYDLSREALMQHSKAGEQEEEKASYHLASELMAKRASTEERYRLLSQRREELLNEEQNLERFVSKSEKMGNRLRMVMNLMAMPEEFEESPETALNKEAMLTAFQIAEREFRSLARELHDGPTQTFSALGLTLEMVQELLSRGDSAAAADELKLSLEQVRIGLDEVRSLLFSLSPAGLDEDFAIPLKRLATQIRQTWKCELSSRLTGKLEDVTGSVRSGAFKTLHQAVLNAARNGAGEVKVSLGYSNKTLRVRIVDNGNGFDVEKERKVAKERGSYGLLNMEERITMLGGNFSITSTPGKGTTVSFAIPVIKGG